MYIIHVVFQDDVDWKAQGLQESQHTEIQEWIKSYKHKRDKVQKKSDNIGKGGAVEVASL